MLLPPPSGCADTFSPGYADCMPATTQPQCLHSKDAQFCLKLALPCAQPSHLASSLPQISSPVTPKWILQCIESEGHPFSRATLPISKARWIVGFFVFFFFQHQELTGNTESISKGIPDVPDPYLTWQGHQ